MKTVLYLLSVIVLANAGFLGAPVYRRNEIPQVASLLQVIGQYFVVRPGSSSTYSHLPGDDTAAIVGALYGGQGHHSGYAYGGSSSSHLSPDVTAAVVASLYGGHGQQAHRVSQDVKTYRVIAENKNVGSSTAGHGQSVTTVSGGHGASVSQTVATTSGGHGAAVSHTTGGQGSGGYKYEGKAGGYHYGGKRI